MGTLITRTLHLLCEGVARFVGGVTFEGGVSGVSYNALTDRPDVYTKVEVDERVDEKVATVKSEVDELRERVVKLEEQVESLLATVKAMSTYDDILFRLIDLTKEIMNVKREG